MHTIGILMAAGRGTRMDPLTQSIPKPLAKITVNSQSKSELFGLNQKSLLEINLLKIEPLVDSFVIVIFYLGEKIIEKIESKFMGKKVQYVWADGYATGTLDAFRTGVYRSNNEKDTNYIVSNSDNLCGQDFYSRLKSKITENPKKAYLMATKIEDRELLTKVGVFVVDEQNNFIRVAEKSPVFVSDLANVGIYYFPNNVASLISSVRVKDLDKEETITDLFNKYSQIHPIEIIPSTDYNIEISTVGDLKIRQHGKK